MRGGEGVEEEEVEDEKGGGVKDVHNVEQAGNAGRRKWRSQEEG